MKNTQKKNEIAPLGMVGVYYSGVCAEVHKELGQKRNTSKTLFAGPFRKDEADIARGIALVVNNNVPSKLIAGAKKLEGFLRAIMSEEKRLKELCKMAPDNLIFQGEWQAIVSQAATAHVLLSEIYSEGKYS